jgi:integrase
MRKKPIFVKIASGIGLGYRRNKTAGTWVARVADGRGGNWTKAIGNADDFDEANGNLILDFWQAQERARTIGRADGGGSQKPMTVREALDAYEADLRTRQRDTGNVTRLRVHLPDSLLIKTVPLLTSRELRAWRDGLARRTPGRKPAAGFADPNPEPLTASAINRTATVFRAVLNLAASHDERIANRRVWETGLAAIPDAHQPRNVILPEPVIRQIIAEAHKQNAGFGLLVEVAAVTGSRVSQLKRLEVQDFQDDRGAPRLMIPTSRKGSAIKKILRRPVPIPIGLAAKLRAVVAGRPAIAPLLTKTSGAPWARTDHGIRFASTVEAAGLNSDVVTIYALRHSNIVRQLLANVPVRVVAANHDTSVVMIERTYSHHIADHADALVRGAMLDIPEPTKGTVVPIRA